MVGVGVSNKYAMWARCHSGPVVYLYIDSDDIRNIRYGVEINPNRVNSVHFKYSK